MNMYRSVINLDGSYSTHWASDPSSGLNFHRIQHLKVSEKGYKENIRVGLESKFENLSGSVVATHIK